MRTPERGATLESGRGVSRFVISGPRVYLQFRVAKFDAYGMKKPGLLADLSGIEAEQVLRSQLEENIREDGI